MAQTDPWAVVDVKPAGPVPTAPKHEPKTPQHDPWAVVETKPVESAGPPKPDMSDTMAVPNPKGMAAPGNLPIWNRPVVQNADGTHSSEYSTSFEQDGKEVLVPTVVNGKFLTPDGKKPKEGSPEEKAMFKAAWQHYLKTGQHLGKFDNSADADAYAGVLHSRGAKPQAEVSPDLKIHPEATVEAWKPTWAQRIRQSLTQSQPFHTLETFAPSVASALHVTPTDVSGTPEYYEHKSELLAGEPLTQGIFRKDAADKPGVWEKRATGVATGVAGLTTPDMILLQMIPVGDLLGLGGGLSKMVLPRMVTAGFGASMVKGFIDQWKERQKAKDAGDENAVHEIEGQMSVTALMTVLLGHSATRDLSETFTKHANANVLDENAQTVYGAKYSELNDKQKSNVVYNVAADADPITKAKLKKETKRLVEVQRKAGLSLEELSKTAESKQQEYEQRADAAKKFVQQVLIRHQREQAYRADMAAREAEARQAEAARQKAIDRAAAEATSQEQRRGYPVEESRTAENLPVTGLRKTTEREPGQRYEPEPGEPAIPVTDRRAAPDLPLEPKPEVLAAERKVQELAEDRMGQSFSTLPLSRQMVAARWMERFQPEAWAAFQGTPAHQTYTAHVEMAGMADAALKHYMDRNATGESQTLAPNADVHTGMARLILDRTDVNAVLKADPATARDLNEHAEKSMGKSFDSLAPEDRKAALSEYLRDKPEKLQAFLTPDLADRIASGQHIDLANMEAELIDKQQVHMLMEERDRIRQDMEEGLSRKLVTEERSKREKELSDTLYSALTGREPTLENVHAVSSRSHAGGLRPGPGRGQWTRRPVPD